MKGAPNDKEEGDGGEDLAGEAGGVISVGWEEGADDRLGRYEYE